MRLCVCVSACCSYWVVCVEQITHHVCIDPAAPNCTQCRVWGHYRALCAHMLLVLVQKRPDLFQEGGRRTLVRDYFHPAYQVENCILAIGQQLTAPQANFGPFVAAVGDIVVIDSDGEEVNSEAAPAVNPMLPPFKFTMDQYKLNARRGRPRTRRRRSRGAASSADGGAPVRVGVDAPTAEDRARQTLAGLDFDL